MNTITSYADTQASRVNRSLLGALGKINFFLLLFKLCMCFSAFQVFQGNWDKDTVVTQILSRKIFARFIRFNPVSWEINGYICLRVEIYECLPAKGKKFDLQLFLLIHS